MRAGGEEGATHLSTWRQVGKGRPQPSAGHKPGESTRARRGGRWTRTPGSPGQPPGGLDLKVDASHSTGTCSMPCVSGAVLSAVQMSRDLILLAARGGGDCAVLILQMKKGAQRGWGTWPGPQRRLGPSFSSSGRSAGGRGAPPGPVVLTEGSNLHPLNWQVDYLLLSHLGGPNKKL